MGWASHAFAQTEVDALRYSQLQFGGSARTQATGGANVALGADFGNLSSNPAGLGLYRKSELTFTPGYGMGSTSSTGLGNQTKDSRNNLHIASLGVVFVNRRADGDNASDWRGGGLGLGLTRINDFNNRFSYSGSVDNNRSLLQYLRETPSSNYDDIITQFNRDAYTTLDGLAYATSLTNIESPYQGAPDMVVTPLDNAPVMQREYVQTTGSQTQYDLGYGASYRDKLYIGGAIGIVSTRYNEDRVFNGMGTEPASGTIPTRTTSFTLNDYYTTRGTGFNARIGAIYRVSDFVRVGASAQTPTYMRLNDSYTSSLSTSFDPALIYYNDNGTVNSTVASASAGTLPGESVYTLTTPFRAAGGVAVTVGKYGFLTGDVEYVNYSQARLKDNSDNNFSSTAAPSDYSAANQAVQDLYRSAVNLRIGGEARYDIFRFRLGYARYGDPYKANAFNRTQNYFTGGLGLRQQNLFLDLAGVYNTSDRFYNPYTLNNGAQPVIAVSNNKFTTTATIGLTF